jgi:virginiamycin B lyase
MKSRIWMSLLAAGQIFLAQEAAPASASKPQPAKAKRVRTPRPGVPGVQKPISTVTPDMVFAVENTPDWLVSSGTEKDGAMWVSAIRGTKVARMNPKTGKVDALIELGTNPCSGLAWGFESIWVPLCKTNELARIDIKKNEVVAKIPYGPPQSEGSIATTSDSVWMLTGKEGRTLLRIDPDTNKPVAEIAVAEGSFAVVAGEGAVWVTSFKKNVVSRVDPKSNLVTDEIEVDGEPLFLCVGEGFVWTLNQKKGNVSKIDPKLKKVVATIEVGIPGPGGEISAGDGSVWVTNFEIPVSRIDPETNKVTHQYIGPGGDSIKVGHKAVWVSNLRENNVWKVNPGKMGGKDQE